MTAATTPTPSLRRRVTVATVGVIATLLIVLGAAIDHVVGVQLNRDLEARLSDNIVRAANLVKAGVGPAELVTQLQGHQIRVQVIGRDGTRYGDRTLVPVSSPPLPRVGPPPPPSRGERTSKTVTRVLRDGSKLTMVANTTGIHARQAELRRDLLVGGTAALVVVTLLVRLAVGRALAPLRRITATAERITNGDRGRRLHPDRPTTELGHAAAAFDNMLDALEDAEINARRAAENAQQAEAKTRQFLSDAAHELRSPVAGIQAVVQQLTATTEATGDADDATTARRRRYTALLDREARRAARLVSDMLDIASIDAGIVQPDEEVDLLDIVAAEVDRAAMLAPALTVRLVGDGNRLPIYADPSRVSQILSNVLDNARRYTPSGGAITVCTAVRNHNAEVLITDSGPGIPPADRERVFDRLVRLDGSRGRDSGGAGLGLPIARALARAHHGALECLPRATGAQFRLTLPLAPAAVPPRGGGSMAIPRTVSRTLSRGARTPAAATAGDREPEGPSNALSPKWRRGRGGFTPPPPPTSRPRGS
ncbi:HAMP domain-containing histidine kinase [Mycobacterium sp. SM1]|uniref:sensor histidine kinase n=1 Tax=Mycobacterium sp. SM1 TaxID=2816243 RepID=UPI001BCDBF0E|nr:HAMP domain-containing sensor histidine kinase [Mycobacterium sp. SM1]MBS4727484.1 HAMP domain-containing histidine kinase [Mycobacterium sp. SM1]